MGPQMVCRLSLLAIVLLVTACAPPPAVVPPPPPVATVGREPTVRVRVVAGAPRVIVASTAPVIVTDQVGMARPQHLSGPLTIARRRGTFVIAARGRDPMQWALPTLKLSSPSMRIGDLKLPGTLVVTPAGAAGDRVDVIHHVALERYLPGVLVKELYGSWEPATYEAQAIAARSYALWRRALSPRRYYDLEATTASQVYGGVTDNKKALAAVQRTRGQVLAFGGRIVPAFYSAASGGRSQDAAVAFPNQAPDIRPLWGGPRGDWDRESHYHRWGPIHRDKVDLARRIAGWGRRHRHPVAALRHVASIRIAQRSRSGRPAAFVITDKNLRTFKLLAEQFRFACNFTDEGQPGLDKTKQLLSSDVQIDDNPRFVSFNGHGHGHGVGMSQWGAQALARNGYNAMDILAFYYPGATIERAY